MKISALFLLSALAMLAAGCASAAHSLMPVSSQGETLIVATVGKLAIKVVIKTQEIQIARPRPAVIQTSCTYSRYPCSIVERLDITVNGNAIFVPRSAFCDLADLTKGEVGAGETAAVLTLYGGDASESYIVKIEFDAIRVMRRTRSGAVLPDEPSQETIYHLRVLGD